MEEMKSDTLATQLVGVGIGTLLESGLGCLLGKQALPSAWQGELALLNLSVQQSWANVYREWVFLMTFLF